MARNDVALSASNSVIGLQSPGVMTFIRQREPAGVSEHVRMCSKAEPGGLTSARYNLGKARCRERRAALRGKHERRLGLLLALQLP